MRKKAVEQHILAGTYRNDRHAPPDASAPAGRPPKPKHLGDLEAAEWERLAALAESNRTLSTADGPILEAAAIAYGSLRRANDVLTAHGLTYATKTPQGSEMVRPRPEVAIAAEAWRRWVTALSHFGLSPATRSKVAVAPVARPESKLAKLIAMPPRAVR